MGITDYQAKYLAHELTLRRSSDSIEKLATALSDAQVDLNPHQVDAALFAFQSPFSKGAVLADEVGLGKTIEAGLLLSQKWAERKRKLLVILPANLRKQWSQELADKFHLPSAILETRTFNDAIKRGSLNPFERPAIVLCSYQFARNKDAYVRLIPWDLVVIDEAHRLRNVYKPTNKIANAIKDAVMGAPKVLLTATPLQNSLLELFGLISVIDDHTFGDLKSFRDRFSRAADDADFTELKARLKPICKRTLRRQVLEYVPYTNRHAIVEEFYPNADEQKLYDLVSAYLQRPILHALPASQRQLMTLILRKLIASSTYAISGTLDGLVKKLGAAEAQAAAVDAPPDDVSNDVETFDELVDEWDGDEEPPADAKRALTPEQLAELRDEMVQLREFHALARSIIKNSKGDVLLTALRKGFVEAKRLSGGAAPPKAVIFTESRKTQEYLQRVLEAEFAGKVTLFNGTNTDPGSKAIYKKWLERHQGTDRVSGSPAADMRAALVDQFRDESTILIATEAAAEGINLQFCNLVVNYDMPWNPQRVEQRIGRCHRYGQKFDVVVVNFLNKSNAADQRVYQLLDEKFRLFDGVFGASDEVIGAVESGVDFEKRIAGIYQKCRTPQQISFEFDALQRELENEIAEGHRDAREKLLNNFDQEVIERVKLQSHDVLDRFNERLWLLAQHALRDHATFSIDDHSFTLHTNPFPDETIHSGPYVMGKATDEGNTFRVGHPIAQRVIAAAGAKPLPPIEIGVDYSGSGKKIAIVEPLVGSSGWIRCERMAVNSIEPEDHLIFSAQLDSGDTLDDAQCRRLMELPAAIGGASDVQPEVVQALDRARVEAERPIMETLGTRNGHWFDAEMDKLDRWAEDRRTTLKAELTDLDERLRDAKKAGRFAPSLPEKLERQRDAKRLETRRDEAWREFDRASRDVDRQKDEILDEVARRMLTYVERTELFTARVRVR